MESLHDTWLNNINAKYTGYPNGLILFLEDMVDALRSQNAALLDMLNNLARWVGKGIADGAYSDCVNSERAMVDLERATEAIRIAKEK